MLTKILNSRLIIVFVLPFILGLSSIYSFAPYNFFFLNFLIIPALFLILSYVRKRSKNIYRKKPFLSNLFYVGYFFGIGFFLSATYWISYSLTFDKTFNYLIPFSLILMPAFLGLFYGIASLLSGFFIKNNFSSILLFCGSFSFMDYLRGKILSGFPWNLWSYSISHYPEMLQLISRIGTFAFNLIVLTFFCLPILLIFKKKINYLIFSLFIVFVYSNYIYGSYVINNNIDEVLKLKNNDKTNINLKIISPNFKLKYNLSDSDISDSLTKLIKYSEPKKNTKTIFIWPEGVFSGYYFEDIKKFKDKIKNNFSEKHLIIFGSNTLDKNTNQYYNSLVVINNNFDLIYRYNKVKLVPFGEFLPAKNIFNKIGLKKITQGYGSFSKGKSQNNLIFQNLNMLPMICYEIIFPEIVQSSSINTNLIVNISEDAWFGNSVGPHQHFSKAIFRAIESNTYLARSANQGISAFINNKGQVLKSLRPNEKGNIELIVPLVNSNLKNRNDLIFFILLFTYTIIFLTLRNK